MGGLLFYLVGLWVGSAFAPDALARQLGEAVQRGHLPLAFACAMEEDLALELHYSRHSVGATYRPPRAQTSEALALYAPSYLRGLRLVPVVDMPVDVGEGYFHALLDGHLRRELGRPAGALSAELRRRADEAMADVPEEDRVEAYIDALASFGSHLLAVTNELERKELQRSDSGGLCPLLGRRLPLLDLWERIFTTEPYPGAYVTRGGQVRFSQSTLRWEDKRFLLERVLEDRWSGSIVDDLGPRYCAR